MPPGVFMDHPHRRLHRERVGRGEREAGEGEEDDDMEMLPGILTNDGGSFSKTTTSAVATATTSATTTATANTPIALPTVPHISPGAFNYTFLPDMSLATATTTSLTTGVGVRGAADLGYSGFGGGGGVGVTLHPPRTPPRIHIQPRLPPEKVGTGVRL
ncbi:hypothetical protein GYMLUDRAFT_459883 [Collybiopsis luxurians FD-317 M1]|uniref:Uncharacterized protein n=1 Tax=Collybiopsis luxurians FD-317 M1 TaxID=944289 RepID=A0A0D0BYK5_9AGAR|nr:hypothetical protein GYMLUDRAFT_459883 [Collybiopsis luxurians FD-317 M1]